MITPSTPVLLSSKSQTGIVELLKEVRRMQSYTVNMREQFRNIDLAYMREQDLTTNNQRAKIANRYGDADKYQNITVPIVLPQVEAAVTYQASVFLTGSPIFGVVSDPANMDAAMQMETVIDEQAVRGGWNKQFMLAFRDAFKYNFYAIEVEWGRIVTAALETDLGFSQKEARPKEVLWEGNIAKRLDPYNTLFDVRVPPTELHSKGEYVGYTELMSRIQLKAFVASMPNKIISNVIPAFESGVAIGGVSSNSTTASYYIPQLNPDLLLSRDLRDGGINWMAWAQLNGADADQAIHYKNSYQVTTLYAKILPDDFGMKVPNRQTPQVWKFIFVNDQVLLYAERKTNAHGFLPVLCGQGLEDGLSYQTKSLATNVTPLQQLSSTMWNSVIASRRRAISDRVLYDPSRVSEAHINNPNPSAKIPVRPAAYGKPISESVYAFPFRDDQAAVVLQESAQVEAMANKTSRQNPVRQGQFVKGNKTRDEFQDVMQNANGGDQMVAIAFESNLFTPMKEIIKLNILQYQGGTSLYNRQKETQVQIDPVTLRKAVMTFKISDGLSPSDKIISGDAMRDGLQAMAQIPGIGAGYNVTQLFSYLMKVQGADLKAFEKSPEQIAFEQAMGQWQQIVELQLKANPLATQKDFPPQPVPQQFGYVPAGSQQGATNAPV
jgi:hypothetical protein